MLTPLIFLSLASLFTLLHFYTPLFQPAIQHLSYLRPSEPIPDFSLHRTVVQTISEENWDTHRRRIIVIGDLHGMIHQLRQLLSDIKYQPSTDTLVHVGDIITKGPLTGSLDVLSFMTSHNVTGVRGNHDQKVIQWRAWIDWITTLPGGRKWLRSLRKEWTEAQRTNPDLEQWLERKRRRSSRDRKWWKRIPKGWQLFSEHFSIAEQLSADQHRYLSGLPVVVHAPSAHAFVVHAGILPSDPTHKPSHPKQPLARVPKVPKISKKTLDVKLLRRLQEAEILSVVPQNRDPWVLMNMRSLSRRGEVIRDGNIGQPWTTVWNDVVSRCNGFHPGKYSDGPSADSLPCYPSTVVYGHSAARGLDPQRWSIGLDSGCVYGRHLTALVIGKKAVDDVGPFRHAKRIPFGDKEHGRLYSIKCH